jgi:hypothetical protein
MLINPSYLLEALANATVVAACKKKEKVLLNNSLQILESSL